MEDGLQHISCSVKIRRLLRLLTNPDKFSRTTFARDLSVFLFRLISRRIPIGIILLYLFK